MKNLFPANRTTALERLSAFAPLAGPEYARLRNFDLHSDRSGGVSQLSPYIRHRLLTEEEVLRAVLERFSLKTADKFVQEVFWRTYWKGWLEQRPEVWTQYQTDLSKALNSIQTQSGMRSEWEAACLGQTDIDCFNYWAQELVYTGYLHNHARMWFASIWIFTLKLPWVLGADFFMRHLLDGDPASNTLSWRWVAGLQTIGKTYLARPSNIETYTRGRFNPIGQLAMEATPPKGRPHPDRRPIPLGDRLDPMGRYALLLTDEDLSPSALFDQGLAPVASACLQPQSPSPLTLSPCVSSFKKDSQTDVIKRFRDRTGACEMITAEELKTWFDSTGADHLVTAFLPVGPTRDALGKTGLQITQIQRQYDQAAWPLATHGFFRFKENIPELVEGLKGPRAI